MLCLFQQKTENYDTDTRTHAETNRRNTSHTASKQAKGDVCMCKSTCVSRETWEKNRTTWTEN